MMPFGHASSTPAPDASPPVDTTSPPPQPTPPPPTTINPLALRLNAPPMTTPISDYWYDEPEPMEDVVNGGCTVVVANGGGRLRKAVRPNPLPYANRRTGICYDVRMRFHATIDDDEMHPEDPRRIMEIYKAIVEAGLVDDPNCVGAVKKGDLMIGIKARPVTKQEALLVHSQEHWDFLEATKDLEHAELQELTKQGDSVYFNGESFFCSQLSCGGAIETCEAVMSGTVKNAIAVIRPPGHHAEPHKAMGFCLFNNVCVATKVMQQKYPDQCKKVLILDWDVHHGNGTQATFYEDPSVLYMSIHRYQGGKFYPEGPHGNLDQCGAGEGLGVNVNVPWPSGGMGDGDYMYAFQRVIMPIAMEFNPDLVIVSAGFDAAAGDSLGGCFVTPAGYAHMTHMLMALANGKVVVCLEGGYNLQSISKSALAVTRVLMGEPPGKLHEGGIACKSAVEVVHQCVIQQSRYWRCMKPREIIPSERYEHNQIVEAAKLNDVIRLYQAKRLWDQHKMTVLPIFRDRISESFVNQVIATAEYVNKETIVFFVHDPYVGQPMLDAGTFYINWAISKGFGFIDANIPRALAGDNAGYDPQKQTEELCIYIWDNYLEISDAKNIILVGVGEAVLGLQHLIINRECKEMVKGIVSFIGDDTTLRSINPAVPDEALIDWYYNNTCIFVSKEHTVWARQKRPRRKFGHLIKPQTNTQTLGIMIECQGMTVEWIEKKLGSQ